MGVELTWQPPNVIFPSFSTRIGIPGGIDIVVLSGEIFSTCFSYKFSPPIQNNYNIYDIVLVVFGK